MSNRAYVGAVGKVKQNVLVGAVMKTKPEERISSTSAPNHEKEKTKGQTVVRYITEELIKRHADHDHFDLVTTLNLNLGKEGGKIKYIENLEHLKRLQVLNLSGNAIEKIEKLDKLTNLQELNLSYNSLTKIENLEALSGLQVLNLAGNQIQHIPLWMTKKLKALRVFSIDRNQIDSIDEISRLQSLSNLVKLSVANNPVSILPHCRLLVVFHLRTLHTLDGQEVTMEERSEARQRFEQEEVERLRNQLEKVDLEKQRLVNLYSQSMKNEEEVKRNLKSAEEERQALNQQLKEKAKEQETTVQLLNKKTSELTRFSKKQYEMEQELAFYKIDHKFASLSRQAPDTPDSMSMEDGESPYIGKARYRANEYAHEGFIEAKPIQVAQGQVSSRPVAAHSSTGRAGVEKVPGVVLEQVKLAESVNQELEEKQKQLRKAEVYLKQLQSELEKTEQDLSRASKERNALLTSDLQSTENEKQAIRETLAVKSNQVNRLRQEAENIDGAMRVAQEEIYDKDRELKQVLMQMDGTDSSVYMSLKREAGMREQQLNQVQLKYKHLQGQLEQRLATLKGEAEEVKKLEEELRSGHMVQSKELKQELESIIRGLGSYLSGVRQTAGAQGLELAGLIRDRAELVQKCKKLEQERQVILKKANQEAAYLKQQLADLEESMREQQSINESLQHHLNESHTQDVGESSENIRHLQEASEENEHLRKSLALLQAEKQAEKESFEKQLYSDGRRLNQMRQRIRETELKDNENQNLHRELAELQSANVRLQDQLYGAQQQLLQQKQTSIDPEALRRRLEEVTKAVRTSKGMGRGEGGVGKTVQMSRSKSDDPVEQAIGILEENVQREMEKKSAELDKAQWANDRMESRLQDLKDEIIQVQEEERSMAEQAIQAVAENERMERENLLAEIHRLEEELAREQAKHRSTKASRGRNSTGQSTVTVTSGSGSSSTGSTVRTGSSSTEKASSSATSSATSLSSSSSTSSSVWSARKREIYNTMTNEEKSLFDELQKEIEELRRLLAANDKQAASKVEGAKRKTDKLKEMVDRRYRSVGVSAGSGGSSAGSSSPSSVNSAPSEAEDVQVQEALEELENVQSEIKDLRARLIEKSRGRGQSRVAYQDERNQLYEILDDQRKEINHLSRALDEEVRQRGMGTSQYPVPPLQQSSGIPQTTFYRSENGALPPSVLPPPVQPLEGHLEPSFKTHPMLESQRAILPLQQNVNPAYLPKDHYGGRMPQTAGTLPQDPHLSPHALYPSTQYPPHGFASAAGGYPIVNAIQHPMALDYGLHPSNPGASGLQQMLPMGMTQVPAQPDAALLPQQQVAYPGASTVIVPTTSLANPGFGQPFILAPASGTATGQPVMMSTPLSGTGSPHKGALVTGDRSMGADHTGALFCNVPEHHDLEDHVAKLQHKLKDLRSSLRKEEEEESSFRERASHRVTFEDDGWVTRAAVLRLQSELEERRIEMEGLDLAIERQKNILKEMKQRETTLLAKREAINKEFESLQRGQQERKNFQAYLEATSPIPDFPVSDLDLVWSEYNSGKAYLISELKCAETTLSSRREDLAEVELRLVECKKELTSAQRELSESRTEYHKTAEAQKEMERCAHDTGVVLLDTEAKVKETQVEVEKLEDQKNQLKTMLSDIEDVIQVKDEEFQILQLKLEQATECLESLGKESLDDDARVVREQDVLDLVNQELLSKQQDLEDLMTEIQKQQALLEMVNAEVDGDLESKHREVLTVIKELENLQAKKHHLADEIESKEKRLSTICGEIDREKSVLKSLLFDKSRKSSELNDVQIQLQRLKADVVESQTHQLQMRDTELNDVSSKVDAQLSEMTQLELKNKELLQDSERLKLENQKRTADVERLQHQMAREKNEYESLESEKKSLESLLSHLRWDKKTLGEEEKKLNSQISDLNRLHIETQTAVQEQRQKLTRLNKELMKIEEAFDNVQHQHALLNGELSGLRSQIEDGRFELIEVEGHRHDAEQNIRILSEQEANRRQIHEAGFSSLEHRVKNLGKEILRRDNEIEQLKFALAQAKLDYEHRQSLFTVEMNALQDKSAKTIHDLETIARSQYARANRLIDEMSYQRAECLELKRQLDTKKDLVERESRLVEAITNFKSDLQHEVTDNILDFERSRKSLMLKEVQKVNEENDDLELNIKNLKQNLHLAAELQTPSASEGPGGLSLLHAKLDMLKAQQESIKKANFGNIERHLQMKPSLNEDKLIELEQTMRQAEQISQQTDTAKLAQLQATRTEPSPDSHSKPTDEHSAGSSTSV